MAQKGFNGLTDEAKSRIEEAITMFQQLGGGSSNDWLEKVADMFIMEQLKEGNPEFVTELKELDALQGRVYRMVANMVDRVGSEKQEVTARHREQIEELRLQIESLVVELTDQKKLTKIAEETITQAAKDKADMEKQVKQLEESAENNRELIASQKEKIGQLGDLVGEYKAAYDERNGIRDQLVAAQDTIEKLRRELAEERETVESLAKIGDERVRQAEERHQAELERQLDRKEVEHEREILRLRTELHAESQKATQEATAEIRSLYERMDKLREEYERKIDELKNPPKEK